MALLSDEAQTLLTSEINNAMLNAVNKINDNKELAKPFLTTIKDVCSYLNISRPTYNKLVKKGLPIHKINGVAFWYKQELIKFITQQ